MDEIRVIDIKESILEDNDKEANKLRKELIEQRTFLLNVMSSPGAGKTASIIRIIRELKNEFRIGVMEADIDSTVDAERIVKEGVIAIQLHTGGMCHLDCGMTRKGLESLEAKKFDLVILENVGNLVCPAEFDTGASRSMMILSVPEGDDKSLKYPLMFSICDALIINKIDCLPYFDFKIGALRERVKKLKSDIAIFEVSATTGEGFDTLVEWLRSETKAWNCLEGAYENRSIYTD